MPPSQAHANTYAACMRVFVSIDMEGVAGVSDRRHVDRGSDDFAVHRTLMAGEANAVVAGAAAAGATRILVNDSHGDMANLLPTDLDPRAELVTGSVKPSGMLAAHQEADVALFVGYHARAGTAAAVLDHSYSSTCVYEIRLNGEPVGEAELNAGVLGSAGIPVALVSGDQTACAQIGAVLPGIRQVVVKQALGHRGAVHLHPERARELLRSATEEVLRGPLPVPYRPRGPYTVEMDFYLTSMADLAQSVPGSRRTGPRTLAFTSDDLGELARARNALVGLASLAVGR